MAVGTVDITEYKLLERARSGDRDAFEAIVLANEKPLYHLALRTLKHPEDAADAVQETFLKAYVGLNSFRGDSKLSVWLYRIMANVCTDALRRRRDAVSLTEEDEGDGAGELDLPDDRWDPAALAERKDTQERVRKALDKLPDEFRRTLLLREYSGLSYEEIGAALELPVATVKTRIFRARKKLCALLTADGNFSAPSSSKQTKGGERA